MTKGEKGVLDAALDINAELLADNIKLSKKYMISKGIIALLLSILVITRLKK